MLILILSNDVFIFHPQHYLVKYSRKHRHSGNSYFDAGKWCSNCANPIPDSFGLLKCSKNIGIPKGKLKIDYEPDQCVGQSWLSVGQAVKFSTNFGQFSDLFNGGENPNMSLGGICISPSLLVDLVQDSLSPIKSMFFIMPHKFTYIFCGFLYNERIGKIITYFLEF